MEESLDRSEAFLEAERDTPIPVATAVLHEVRGTRQTPALGMAVIEVNAGGLGLRIAAQLSQGTHHVYILDDVTPCGGVDAESLDLFGSPDPDRPGYLGALENVRDGPARFERHVSDGIPSYQSMIGRPLVLVHAKRDTVICGVFRTSDEDLLTSR